MILVDANLLIYAHVSNFLQHERAREWLDARLNGVAPVGLAWSSILAFLRLDFARFAELHWENPLVTERDG